MKTGAMVKSVRVRSAQRTNQNAPYHRKQVELYKNGFFYYNCQFLRADWFSVMVNESIDHENDAICRNATRAHVQF